MNALEHSFCSRAILRRIYPIILEFNGNVIKRQMRTGINSTRSQSKLKLKTPNSHTKRFWHTINLRTDGAVETILRNTRRLYNDLRDEFAANRGFNIVLLVVVTSYLATPLGRLFLEYKRDKREDKRIEMEYQLHMDKCKSESKKK